jgi:hypothetical protein
MISPGLLLDHIRRPETTSDSTSFAMISGAMWVIGVFIYKFYWLQFVLPTSTAFEKDADPMWYWLTAAIDAGLVGGGLFLWLTVGPKLYRSLGATELKGANPALLQNCFNYALGPSILALVPVFGWALAIVWILFILIVAGKQRLFIKGVSAVINIMIMFSIVVASTVGVWLFLTFVWGGLLDNDGLTRKAPPPPPIKVPTRE